MGFYEDAQKEYEQDEQQFLQRNAAVEQAKMREKTEKGGKLKRVGNGLAGGMTGGSTAMVFAANMFDGMADDALMNPMFNQLPTGEGLSDGGHAKQAQVSPDMEQKNPAGRTHMNMPGNSSGREAPHVGKLGNGGKKVAPHMPTATERAEAAAEEIERNARREAMMETNEMAFGSYF